MQPTSWIFVLSGLILSPILLGVCALFAGLWRKTTDQSLMTAPSWREEELGI